MSKDDEAARIEQTLRRGLRMQPSHGTPIEPKPKPDPSRTYFGRMQAGLVDGAAGGYLVGSEPTVLAPFAPSPIAWDTGNLEPPLGEDVNAVPDMNTVAHGGSALLPPTDGDEQ